jgi:hypothetical protein
MHTLPLSLRSQRTGYAAVLALVGAGALLFLVLVLQWTPATLSRPALGLQALALVLALVLAHGHPPRRLLLHPLLLAAGIYLWDTTLPPPSLPAGPLRTIVPAVLLAGLVLDWLLVLRRLVRHSSGGPLARADQLPLDAAAQILGMSPNDVRARVQSSGGIVKIARDGTEYLTFDDLCDLILRSALDDSAL